GPGRRVGDASARFARAEIQLTTAPAATARKASPPAQRRRPGPMPNFMPRSPSLLLRRPYVSDDLDFARRRHVAEGRAADFTPIRPGWHGVSMVDDPDLTPALVHPPTLQDDPGGERPLPVEPLVRPAPQRIDARA